MALPEPPADLGPARPHAIGVALAGLRAVVGGVREGLARPVAKGLRDPVREPGEGRDPLAPPGRGERGVDVPERARGHERRDARTALGPTRHHVHHPAEAPLVAHVERPPRHVHPLHLGEVHVEGGRVHAVGTRAVDALAVHEHVEVTPLEPADHHVVGDRSLAQREHARHPRQRFAHVARGALAKRGGLERVARRRPENGERLAQGGEGQGHLHRPCLPGREIAQEQGRGLEARCRGDELVASRGEVGESEDPLIAARPSCPVLSVPPEDEGDAGKTGSVGPENDSGDGGESALVAGRRHGGPRRPGRPDRHDADRGAEPKREDGSTHGAQRQRASPGTHDVAPPAGVPRTRRRGPASPRGRSRTDDGLRWRRRPAAGEAPGETRASEAVTRRSPE